MLDFIRGGVVLDFNRGSSTGLLQGGMVALDFYRGGGGAALQ